MYLHESKVVDGKIHLSVMVNRNSLEGLDLTAVTAKATLQDGGPEPGPEA